MILRYSHFLEVGRVGNFAGYRIRVPGRIRVVAGSGYVTCDVWHCFFVWYPPLLKEVPSRMTVKVTETYTRHQAVIATFILQAARWVTLCEIKLLRPASGDATALRRDQKRRRSITDGCVGLLATLVVLTEAELSLVGSSSQTTFPVAIALTWSSCSGYSDPATFWRNTRPEPGSRRVSVPPLQFSCWDILTHPVHALVFDNNFGKCGPFSKLFHQLFRNDKALCNSPQRFPPHLQYVATLPCENRKKCYRICILNVTI